MGCTYNSTPNDYARLRTHTIPNLIPAAYTRTNPTVHNHPTPLAGSLIYTDAQPLTAN